MKALATLALLVGPLLAHGQEAAVSPPEEAEHAGNSMDDSGVFSERPAAGVGVNDADINTSGDSPHQR